MVHLVHASPAKRLWVGGLTLAAFVATLAVGNAALPAGRRVTRADVGHDFLAFYTAASFVRDGRARVLYDLPAVRDAERATAAANGIDLGTDFGPWWNPPAYALALRPLASLPYGSALAVWWAISAAAAIGAVALLMRMGVPSPWLVPLLLLVSMPSIQAAGHGQNTFTSLQLLTATVTLWRSGRATAAGLVGGLLFYKPQLAAVLAVVMAVDLGAGAVVGLAITGSAMLAATVVLMPGSLTDWLTTLPTNVHVMQVEHPYLWDRHVTLKAFWRLLLQGKAAGEASPLTTALTVAGVLAVGGGLATAAVRSRGDGTKRDRLIAATVTASPLLMPFYFDYDLLLLAVPLTLYAADVARDRRLTIAWVGLYVVLLFNAPLSGATRVNGAVIALTVVATLSIARAIGSLGPRRRPALMLPSVSYGSVQAGV